MALRRAGVDRVVLALWLGHEKVETTDIYVYADLGNKEQALARTRPPNVRPAATGPPTGSWPSSKSSNYADCNWPIDARKSTARFTVHIIRSSA